MSEKTMYRADYRPPLFSIETVDLSVELYDDHAMVSNQMNIRRMGEGALRLDGDELELVSIHLNNKCLEKSDYTIQDQDLIIENCPNEFDLTIVTRIKPQENTQLSGLYRSNTIFCTQCEAQGFRRITYFLDRPDVLSTFTTRISAAKDRYPVLLSNGNLIDAGEAMDGRHWVLWADPFKKPCYLFALVAGNLASVRDEFVTCSGKKVDLRIYVEPGNEDKCSHAMESLKKAMRWDEDVYGLEYDLSIFMIVAVSDFNMGAMENKGLNIFNSKYILARPDTATDQDYADIEGVVGHEYFHNWTGNRVTCRDWFQLSLKEGLTVFRDQDFSRDMNQGDVNRIMDVNVLRNIQFPEDAGAMAHPVRPESYEEINNFYTPTIYNKGAEVIRMQHTLLGHAGFRKGMDLYFQRHDGQAVTIDDFVAAMQDATGVDLTQFMHWYSQAGTPEVGVQSAYSDGTLTLTLTQHCRSTPECNNKKPFHVPIRMALFNKQGKTLPVEHEVLNLKEAKQTFEIKGLSEKPLISLLRGFSAPVNIKQDSSEDELLALMRFETDGYAKWNAAQCLALTCLTACYHAPDHTMHVSDTLLNAYQHVLSNEEYEPALRAQLLMPPSFEDVAALVNDVDVGLVERARDAFRKHLGSHVFDEANKHYRLMWQDEDHGMHGKAYSRRKLRNVCLWLMMKANEPQSIVQCLHQFTHAKTMTDQLASLGLLVNCSDNDLRQKAIDGFYAQWSADELVLDKWFSIQAVCERPDTLNHVQSLLSHPAFSFKNPNKVRALIGAFCQGNPRHFHAADGSGYAFLSDMLLKIDQLNPQIAARLATPFTRWQRLDKQRQVLMQQNLETLSKTKLSRDLNELVTKSLAR